MAQAQDAFPPPGHARAVAAPYTAVPPILDGHLDDESWQQAAQGRDFWISFENRPPKDETVVLVLRDNFNLYFAFQCYDSDPESIVAIRSRRDAGLGNDDRVGIELDSFHNYRTISTYWVNAIGTQNDEITGGRARKIEWKGDWKASVTRTEYGWSAEFAIPFKILNYHSEARRFGINFLRYQNGTDELSNWADVTPQHKREEMGQLLGLVLPERAKTQPWTLMPYVLGGLNISDIDGDEHDALAYAGATIRYEPRPNVTSVVSLYPDFNQLETQITDIDFSYTEKFRPDPRPFFQEGSAYFGSDIGYFYSNRVPDIWGGAKSFAQYGNNAIGGLFTRAPDNRWDGVVRYVREIDARHSAEAMLVATHQEDLENQLAVVQIDGREKSGLYYEADLAYSNTEKREFDDGGAFVGALGWRADYWSVGINGDYYDEKYFPANALLDNDLYDTKSLSLSASYYRDFAEGVLRGVSGNVNLNARDTIDGRKQNHGLWVDAGVKFRRQIDVLFFYYDADYRPVASRRGRFSDSVNDDYYWGTNLDFNTRSNYFGYGIYFADGSLGDDDYLYVTGYLWFRPTPNTSLKVASERLENFGNSNQTVVNAGWDMTPQDNLVARYVYSEGDDSLRLAYQHTVRSGMDIFSVFNKEPGNDTEFSVKAVWAIQ